MTLAPQLRFTDPDRTVLHRASRVALVTPALFAFGLLVLRDAQFALLACFGSFAALAMADFTGPRGSRLRAYAALGTLGVVLVTAGTLLSHTLWQAVAAMLVVGVVFQFLMVMGGQFALGNNAVILAFVIAVMVPADPSALGPRLAGWVMGIVLSALAATFLWPRHERRDLHEAAAAGARALAKVLRTAAGDADPAPVLAASDAAVARLRDAQAAVGFRPVGTPEHQRALMGLIDGLAHAARFAHALVRLPAAPANAALAQATANALDTVAAVVAASASNLTAPDVPIDALVTARHAHREAIDAAGRAALAGGAPGRTAVDAMRAAFVLRVLSYQALTLAVDAAVIARHPVAVHDDFAVVEPQTPSTVRERWAAALLPQLTLRGVWMRNCLRAGVALALAVLVAKASDISHAFWVVLATLAVLRGNASSTRATIVSALAGTVAGFALATVAMLLLGGRPLALWLLLPVATFLAGFAPAAISFGTGQASFALLVVVLFNLIVPDGWEVGAVRVEAVALGAAVALAASLIMWPRGAAAALRSELALHVRAANAFMAHALGELAGRPAAELPALRDAALAARERADAAMAAFIVERGAKPVPLATWIALARVPVLLRLAGDAAMGLARSGYLGITQGPAATRFTGALEAVAGGFANLATHLEDGKASIVPSLDNQLADLDMPRGAGIEREAILAAIGAWIDAHRDDPDVLVRGTASTWGLGWVGYLAHLRVSTEAALAQVAHEARTK